MIRLQVATYNMKNDKEKVKDFLVEHFNDGDGDMVHVVLGNESFIIRYEMWKMIGRITEDEKDGMFDE